MEERKAIFWLFTLALIFVGSVSVISAIKTSPSEPNPPEVVITDLEETSNAVNSARSAIVEAVNLKEFRLSTNATLDSLDVNLLCSSANHSQCLTFIDRMRWNSGLHDALRYAKTRGIDVYLDDREFNVGSGWVKVNVSATDDKIIEFLMGKNP